MTDLDFLLLNVFTDGDVPFTGNPLAVYPDAAGCSTELMQDLARQFNLSESVFVTGPADEGVDASVRIFMPTNELPFAGHPTLGAAYVVAGGSGDRVVLRMAAGDVPVEPQGGRWVLTAGRPTSAPVTASTEELASALGVPVDAIADGAAFVDTGVRQLLVPLRSVRDLRAAQGNPGLLRQITAEHSDEALAYVWAATGPGEVESRLFFTQNGSVAEDPATGSACANLGGWHVLQGRTGFGLTIRQGAEVGRPSVLHLQVDEDGRSHVGGEVRVLGRGTVTV